LLDWLAQAHAHSANLKPDRLRKLLERYGCGADKIARRGHELEDFLLSDWFRMNVFRLNEDSCGAGILHRMHFYQQGALRAFSAWYPENKLDHPVPDDLIHVSCTGYVSPSAAQVVMSARGQSFRTRVTHAYHMGCYAALPALRMANGFLACGSNAVDIAHTEFCSLHFNPGDLEPEQLVVQTLFADGMIQYRASRHEPREGFELLSLHEEILPDSTEDMKWVISDYGMKMGLSREVPARIASRLQGFMNILLEKAKHFAGDTIPPITFHAVHPGGPRIIDGVRDALGLPESHVTHSRKVLLHHGNMSSATLPHIWKEILADPEVPDGSWIPTLAFGPGLTLTGAVLRKRGDRR
jgi:predicted naringenin-chalcone synthase